MLLCLLAFLIFAPGVLVLAGTGIEKAEICVIQRIIFACRERLGPFAVFGDPSRALGTVGLLA